MSSESSWKRRWRSRWRSWWQGGPATDEGPLPAEETPGDSEDLGDLEDLGDSEDLGDAPEEIVLEVGDVLDLHTFPPKEVKALVRDYLDHAHEQGWEQVRIIHGKGVGVQRRTVRAILERDPRVVAYGDPPGESGGWGATWVRLGGSEEA